tara:strand:- start:185270 stop:186658 length:1389 start_codon:yes stop_codon:yes gene_type:complete
MKRTTVIVILTVLATSLTANLWLVIEPAFAKWRDAKSTLRHGFVPRVLFRENGERRRYMVFVPHTSAESERNGNPVLLFLNGVGENGDDGTNQISNNFGRQIWEMKASFPFLCVMPQCSLDGSWQADSNDTRVALQILDQVTEDYRVDQDKIYVTGVSAGGTGALELAAAYPERFAAVVPIAASLGGSLIEKTADALSVNSIALWSFYNGGDKERVVNSNRVLRRRLVSRGLDATCTEYAQGSHDAWNFSFRDPAMYQWLLRQRKSPKDKRSRFTNLIDPELEHWKQFGEADWQVTEEKVAGEDLILKCDESKGGRDSLLACNRTTAQFELRFDFRCASRNHIELALRDGHSHDQVAQHRLVIRDAIVGESALYSSSGELLVVGDLAAQATLRPNNWNHVQLLVDRGKFLVRINGWNLLSTTDEYDWIGFGLVGRLESRPQFRGILYREAGNGVSKATDASD